MGTRTQGLTGWLGERTTRQWLITAIAAAAVVVLAAVVVVLTAGGRDDEGALPDPEKNRPIAAAIADADGKCSPSGSPGEDNCIVAGVSFSLVPGGWTHRAGQRERDCKAGFISMKTTVLTDGAWVAFTDDRPEQERVRDALAEHGVDSAIRGYCDFGQPG